MARKRSPAYPSIDLEKALSRVRALYKEEHDNLAPVETVLAHWKFGTNSGAGMAQIAALKHYGLLEEKKSSAGRKVKISALALDIVVDESEDSPAKAKAIGRAALNPKLHSELWAKWANKLPSVPSARLYLIRERNFHPDYAGKAYGIYTDTIAFAKLDSSGIIEEDSRGEPVPPGGSDKPPKKNRKSGTAKGPIGMVRDLDIPLQNGGTATFPVPMTSADHALLTTILTGLSPMHVRELPTIGDEKESAESTGE